MCRISGRKQIFVGLAAASVLLVACKSSSSETKSGGTTTASATVVGGASGSGSASTSGGTTSSATGSGGVQASGGTASTGRGGISTTPTGGAGSGGVSGGSGGSAAGGSGGGASRTTSSGGTSGSAGGGAVTSGGSGTGGGLGGGSSTGGGLGGSSGRDAGTGIDANYPPAPTTFDNPIIKYDAPDPTAGPGQNIFTADGAAMVWNDKVYLYVDQDVAPVGANGYVITNWLLYVTSDMVKWESKGSIATCKSLSWCVAGSDGGLAAPQVIERDDKDGNPKFYLYGPANNGQGIAIGVMVADKPEGPFKDPRGIPLVYAADTANLGADHTWRNLDPTAFVDDDGQAYLAFGNKIYFWVKLEDDMIHLKGETYTTDASGKMQNRKLGTAKINVQTQTGAFSDYTEAPWLTKRGSLYYLTYAAGFPETINYATSSSPEGPWQARGVILPRLSSDATTIHQSVFDFRGVSYMGYHDKSLPTGSDYRRSQCMDRLYYNADGTIQKLVRTKK